MCYEYELEYYLRRAEELKNAQAAAKSQAKKPAEAPPSEVKPEPVPA